MSYPDLSFVLSSIFGWQSGDWAHSIKTYGVILSLAMLCSIAIFKQSINQVLTADRICSNRHKAIYQSDNFVWDIFVVLVVSGAIGAKLLALAEVPDLLKKDLFGALFSASGFAAYGALIGGIGGLLLFCLWKKISFIFVADTIMPAALFGFGFGRLGCHISGDGDWGIPVTGFGEIAYDFSRPPDWFNWWPSWLWSSDYSHNIAQQGEAIPGCVGLYCAQLPTPVLVTSLWEMMILVIAAGLMFLLLRKSRKVGVVLSLSLLIFGIERFFIEFFRVNIQYELFVFSLSQAQYIAILLVLTGLTLLAARMIPTGR